MPYAKIDLNRSCLPESKKQPISLDRLLLFWCFTTDAGTSYYGVL